MKARVQFGFLDLAALLVVLVSAKVPHHTDHASCESCQTDACLPLCHGLPDVDNFHIVHVEVSWLQWASTASSCG